MKSKVFVIILLISFIFSCKNVQTKKTVVVSTISPLKEFVDLLLDTTKTSSISLLDKNSDPHTAELSPSKLVILSGADFFITLESNLEFEEKNKNQLLEYANKAIKIELGKTLKTIYDKHVWLSLDNLKIFSTILFDSFSFYRIDDKDSLKKRYERLITRLDSLKEEIKKTVSQKNVRKIFVDHNAFAYLGNEFGLEIEKLSENEDMTTIKDLTRFDKNISKENVRIFIYTNISSSNYAARFQKELKVKTLFVNPLENPLTNFEKILEFMKSL